MNLRDHSPTAEPPVCIGCEDSREHLLNDYDCCPNCRDCNECEARPGTRFVGAEVLCEVCWLDRQLMAADLFDIAADISRSAHGVGT